MKIEIIFSVVIPTYNNCKALKKCLKSIISQDFPKEKYKIIIIDDGSTDGTKKFVKKLRQIHKNIRYYYKKNEGHGSARNLGFCVSQGYYIVSTDDDCIWDKNHLNKIKKSFFELKDADAIGGSIINPYNSKVCWAHQILNFSKWFDHGKIRKMNDIPTANIAYKKEKIKNLKFEVQDSSIGYRDSLFNKALLDNGDCIYFNPDIKVYHYAWESGENIEKLMEKQRKTARGFLKEGYKVHGLIGKFFFRYKIINLLCLRLIPVFYRCLRAGYSKQFLKCLPLLIKGELERGLTIYRGK